MSQLNCEETKRQVNDFLQQELTEAEMDAITEHLANCSSCEGDYLMEQFLNRAIERSCTEDAPEDLAKRIAAQIRTLGEQQHFGVNN